MVLFFWFTRLRFCGSFFRVLSVCIVVSVPRRFRLLRVRWRSTFFVFVAAPPAIHNTVVVCMCVSRYRQVAVVDTNAYVCDLMATVAWRNAQRMTPLIASTFWRPVGPGIFVSTLVANCRLRSCSALPPERGSANCGQNRAVWSCFGFEAKRVTYSVEMHTRRSAPCVYRHQFGGPLRQYAFCIVLRLFRRNRT